MEMYSGKRSKTIARSKTKGMKMSTEYDDLAWFDEQAKPAQRFTPGIDTIADGGYDFEIAAAMLDKTKNSQTRVVNADLIAGGGMRVRYTWFIDSTENMNAFLADLVTLGFPADRWGSGPGKTSLVKALPDAVAKLKGIKFRGQKTTDRPTEGTYAGRVFHKLHINARLSGRAMPTPAQSRTTQQPVGQNAEVETEDIPF